MQTGKNIRDAVHGDLPFTALEREIMDTRTFQRLRGIKQLGTSYYVYPGAVHTRFEHSLGTCFMAKKIMESIERNMHFFFSDAENVIIPLASLLHDVTHIPFGHTLEDERRIFPRHDMDKDRLQALLAEGEVGKILIRENLLGEILDLLVSHDLECSNAYAWQIISHTICADLLDYLRRDTHFCGLKLDYDDRLFRYFLLEDGKLILNLQKNGLFRHDAFSEIIHLLRIRYFLTERVYYHHAKIASGAMLSRAVERAVEKGFKIERLLKLNDDSLIFLLGEQYKSDRAMKKLMEKYLSRQLYKRCYVLTDTNLKETDRRRLSEFYHLNLKGERGKVERKIAKAANIPHEAVIIYAPPPSMNLKEANVLAKIDDGPSRPLGSLGNREVTSLQEKFGKLWKFYVFIDPEYSQRFSVVSNVCADYFGFPNELHLIQKGQLSLFPN